MNEPSTLNIDEETERGRNFHFHCQMKLHNTNWVWKYSILLWRNDFSIIHSSRPNKSRVRKWLPTQVSKYSPSIVSGVMIRFCIYAPPCGPRKMNCYCRILSERTIEWDKGVSACASPTNCHVHVAFILLGESVPFDLWCFFSAFPDNKIKVNRIFAQRLTTIIKRKILSVTN